TTFFALLLITTKDIFVKRLRMGFNHTNYLARIQRCLIENQFIKTLEVVKRRIKAHKKGKRQRYWMFSHAAEEEPASEEEQGAAAASQQNNNQEKEEEKYFKPKMNVFTDKSIGTKQKMIIFKEFERIMNTKFY